MKRALALGLWLAAVVWACSPADMAAERKAVADANAKVNKYCDERAALLRSFEPFPYGGEAGAK